MNYGLRIMGSTRHRSSGGYTHYNTITVNSGQVTGTLTNFPMLFAGTYTQLKTVANGGYVTNVNGYDIIFSSTTASNGSGILPFEIVSYNATTGAVVFWVQVPSMAVGSVIYVLYGDSAISTSQANPTAVWDTNFLQVSHMGQASGAQLLDSTSNGNNSITNTGTQAAGKWGNADNFAITEYAAFPATLSGINASSPVLTISAWVNFPNATNYGIVLDTRSSGAAGIVVYANISTGLAQFVLSGTPNLQGANIADGGWHYVSITYSGGSSGTITGYVDAQTPVSSTATGNGITGYGATFNTGTKTVGGGSYAYGLSTVQEMRVSKIARAAAWFAAEYNNQSAPATFYAVT